LGEDFQEGAAEGESKRELENVTYDKLLYLPSSPNVIKTTTSRRMRWPGMWELWEK